MRYTIPPGRPAAETSGSPTAAANDRHAPRAAAADAAAAHEADPTAAPPANVPLAANPLPEPILPTLGVPVPVFGETTLGTDFVPEYSALILPSAMLATRFLARTPIQELEAGHVVLVLGSTAAIVSASTVAPPIVAYLVVHRSADSTTDAVLVYSNSPASAAVYPRLLTFSPWLSVNQSTVITLNEAGVRARCLPTLMDADKSYQVNLFGAGAGTHVLPIAPVTSLLYDTPESQLKREAREEKLVAVQVCLRGDTAAVNAFVGPARDLGHDAVLARIYPLLTVAQRACPWARPECLPLFLQFLFSSSYLVLKGQGMNLTAQHLLPAPTLDTAAKIETVRHLEQCAQELASGLTTVFCQPGSPLYKQDPLFFNNIMVKPLEQLRSTTHQSSYLGAIPINCVVQAFNSCLADLGAFMRTPANASLPFLEFQAGAMATLDLRPKEIVMAAQTSLHCLELFVIPQFGRFDGKAPAAVANVPPLQSPLSRKRGSSQAGLPALKLQRLSYSPATPNPRGITPGRYAPVMARAPPPTGNVHATRAGPPPAAGTSPYSCVSDFVTKIDPVRYPQGCTTVNCPRRHIPLPSPGQFSAVDKAELLQSLSKMKGTRTAPMIALIQSRN